jgi:hypothetical protein
MPRCSGEVAAEVAQVERCCGAVLESGVVPGDAEVAVSKPPPAAGGRRLVGRRFTSTGGSGVADVPMIPI